MFENIITMAHGAGGVAMTELIDQLFGKKLANPVLDRRDDSAVIQVGDSLLAFTTDSFVVDPLFFPGGDIGRLAVCGTVNDLSCAGAAPLYMSSAFILEEGLDIETLERVVDSMRATADEAGVTVATGDTKVVPKGAADKMFINTAGIGLIHSDNGNPYLLSGSYARPGDAVILSGTIGDHGMAVMSRREGLDFESETVSDVAPLSGLVRMLLDACPGVRALRDPTRGGLASALNEFARQSGVCIEIEESAVPMNDSTRIACELLGIDPFYVANEGKVVSIVAADEAEHAVEVLRAHPLGRDAVRIGSVIDAPAGRVHLITPYGNRRILALAHGEQLPRIC
jgi:hydrogenase expression/formation protein HypE